jgi:hypothetical protein
MDIDLRQIRQQQVRDRERFDALREHGHLPVNEHRDEQRDEPMADADGGEWVDYGEWDEPEVDWEYWGYNSLKEYNDHKWLRHYWGGNEAVWKVLKFQKDLEFDNLRNGKPEWNNPTISQEDADWYHELMTRRDYPNGENPWTDDRLKNPEDEKRRLRIAQDYHDLHWRATRISKREYFELRDEYETNGLGEIELRWDENPYLVYLKIDDPNFRVFTSPTFALRKRQTDSGYHITLADRWYMHKPEVQEALRIFRNKYFTRGPIITHTFRNARVGKNGTTDLNGDNEFERDLNDLQRLGTNKSSAHISMD